jgi:hypothetical protein
MEIGSVILATGPVTALPAPYLIIFMSFFFQVQRTLLPLGKPLPSRVRGY